MSLMGYNKANKTMLIPNTTDYKKIQGNIMDYMEVHMSVCGSGCSCPCKQTSAISVSKHLISAGMCGCNCTCGCNCNAPVMQNRFADQRRINY